MKVECINTQCNWKGDLEDRDVLEYETDPKKMREAIIQLRNLDPLVQQVFDCAHHYNMRSEDLFIMLAYYALKSKNELHVKLIELLQNGSYSHD